MEKWSHREDITMLKATNKGAVVFAGTSEGRSIIEYITAAGIHVHACVATKYGEDVLPSHELLHVSHERMDEARMKEYLADVCPDIVIDATHPYAKEATENIRSASASLAIPYIRLLRDTTDCSAAVSDTNIYVDSPEEAAAFLSGTSGNILLTTGSKELPAFTSVPGYKERLYARVLSLPDIVSECDSLGLRGAHLICMQGPFSEEMNTAILHQTNAAFLVTKETGAAGGFPEKVRAARKCGARLVIIGKPVKEQGTSLSECISMLSHRFHIKTPSKQIYLVGIGTGQPENMTGEAVRCCRGADLIIGAERVAQAAAMTGTKADIKYEWNPESILKYINAHPEYTNIAIVLSGDTGFFSGAEKLFDLVEKETHCRPAVICGISSLAAFCGRIGTSWDTVHIMSLHGAKGNLIANTARYGRVFALLGNENDAALQCCKLTEYGMGETKITIGARLGYDDEQIISGKASEMTDCRTPKLSVLLAQWEPQPGTLAGDYLRSGIHDFPDSAFIREKVPMTKEEIRAVSLAKLRLHKDSVVYDIGAGTGSVSIEMACAAPDGTVYAIEQNPEARSLIEKNRRQFAADNLIIVDGTAPEALAGLPAPTHAFIGGSGGHMKEIISHLLSVNPGIRIVINVIALETLTEALSAVDSLPLTDHDIALLSVSKSRKLGNYNMMTGQNPIWIISCEGKRV